MKLSTTLAAQLAIVPLTPYVLWRYARLKRLMPLGVVQIMTAFLASPVLLGAAAPELHGEFFPQEGYRAIDGIGWVAIILFVGMAAEGMEPRDLVGRGSKIIATAAASLIVPLLFGAGVGYFLADHFPFVAGPKATTQTLVFGIGICIAVTALPILNLILKDMGLIDTPIGRFAMAVALIDDAMLWIFLGILGMMVEAGGGGANSLKLALIFVYAVIVLTLAFAIVRPALQSAHEQGLIAGGDAELACFVVVICSFAAIADFIGLHFIIGAFVGGVSVPNEISRRVIPALSPICTYLLLPFFFMSSALKAQGDFNGIDTLALYALITTIAVIGKFFGGAITARAFGESWRSAFALGALLQAKGLVEIIALRVLVDFGILSTSSFLAFVLMALTTTVIAKPLASSFLDFRPAKLLAVG